LRVPKKHATLRVRMAFRSQRTSRAETIIVLPEKTILTGDVGEVKQMKRVFDEMMAQADMNWSTLGRRLRVSRQYITRFAHNDRVPWDTFRRVCEYMGVDPEHVAEGYYLGARLE
jgi:DNA-binding Xre family transcriptional regulator